jgi:putative transposase
MHWKERSQRRCAYNEPGHAHELTFSCYRRFHFLAAERTCAWLADAIEQARRRLDFSLWAYVFMPDHAHLIVLPRQAIYDIPAILKAIKEPVGVPLPTSAPSHPSGWRASKRGAGRGRSITSGNPEVGTIGTSRRRPRWPG